MIAEFGRGGRAAGLMDRGSERDALDRLAGAIKGGESRALVVRGEPGVGKTVLQGRQPQVDALRGQLDALVTGRAGMGKTTLLAEASARGVVGDRASRCGMRRPASPADDGTSV